jgi:histidyl-tRNA synthetase
VPAIGFAAGVERLMLMSEFTSKAIRPVSVIYVSENEQEYALRMVSDFRSAGIVAEICYGANFKKQMKRASQANSKFVIVVGGDEIKNQIFSVKDFDSGVEEKISVGKLVEFLSKSF